MASPYSEKIWKYLLSKIGNKYGVAGLMGNLEAESGLYPDRLQGDIPYSSASQEYTAKVDNGTISKEEFATDKTGGGGYGLAQWTWAPRKRALYDMWKSGGYSSIGSIDLALDYLWYELQNDYSGVLSVLKNATSIREASNKVLFDFENPENQSESVQNTRTSMGQAWYDKYKDVSGGETVDPELLKNDAIITSAINWALKIANSKAHGYDQGGGSQDRRWGPDYDCSSLVISAYVQAGIDVKSAGAWATSTMKDGFTKCGFKALEYSSSMEFVRGDVILRSGHTELYIGDGKTVSARQDEKGEYNNGVDGDQLQSADRDPADTTVNSPKEEIGVENDFKTQEWTWVLRLPSTGGTGGTPEPPEPPEPPQEKTGMSNVLKWVIWTDRF